MTLGFFGLVVLAVVVGNFMKEILEVLFALFLDFLS